MGSEARVFFHSKQRRRNGSNLANSDRRGLEKAQSFLIRSTPPPGTGPLVIALENGSGHRLSYLRLLLEADRLAKQSTVVIIPRGVAVLSDAEIHLKDLARKPLVVEIEKFDYHAVLKLSKNLKARRVVFPDGDGYLAQAIRPRMKSRNDPKAVLLIMRATGQSSNGLQLFLENLAKATLRTAARTLGGASVFSLVSAAKLVVAAKEVQDPIELTTSEIDWVSIKQSWSDDAASRYWFGVFGALSERKNIPLIVDSLAQVSSAKIGLVIAGRSRMNRMFDSDIRRLRDQGVPVKHYDQILPDEWLDGLIGTVDCVVLAHSNEGPSGVLGKALASGTRVLGAGARSLRKDAQARPREIYWSRLRSTELARAMQQAQKSPRPSPVKLSKSHFAERLVHW